MQDASWVPLIPGRFGITAEQPGADPMWVWADATGYRDLFRKAPGPEDPVWITRKQSQTAMPQRYTSQRITPSDWREHCDPSLTSELTQPIVPERPPREPKAGPVRVRNNPPRSMSQTLVGVIDSGCPFAARYLRSSTGGSRVLSLWDQSDVPALAGPGRFVPAELGYGCALARSQLDTLMTQATSCDGSIDEALCYRLAGHRPMERRLAHGAAVLSQLFAGPVDGTSRRSTQPQAPIDAADLVFVQLPQAAVQDSTSAALTRYLTDGLRYILAHAKQGVTKRIVVNISNGSSRTAHDGSSMVEQALQDWVVHARDELKIPLWIVLAAGNQNEEQRHAVLSRPDAHLDMMLPPGSEMPQYVTVRWPEGHNGLRLRVTPPDGKTVSVDPGQAFGWPCAERPQCGVIWPQPSDSGASRALLAFAPTVADKGRTVARSGRWRIEIEARGREALEAPVAFWISRCQPNLGAVARGVQAAFVDSKEAHNPKRYLRRSVIDRTPVTNGIARAGAWNGLATAGAVGASSGIVVVGSYVLADPRRPTCDYSATGEGPGRRFRGVPDVLAPGDSSHALRGLPVRGNQSGDVLRIAGTSFSAPLLARALANGQPLPTDEPPVLGLP